MNPRFKILDKESPNGINPSNKRNNVLLKPFQWYRDNWYHPPSDDTVDLWQQSTDLPQWMKDYFSWHREQTLHSIPSPAQQQQRYLVLQCLEQDRQCGGLADRILALPFLILMAAQSKRLFKIVWTVPFPLEEFLMPNAVDWMVSVGDLSQQEASLLSTPSIIDKTVFTRVRTIVEAVNDPSEAVVRVRLQDYASAWEYYDQHPLNQALPTALQRYYREIFRALFVPSPPLADAMKTHHIDWMNTNANAQPYSVAHYRALYGSQTPPTSFLSAVAKNAVHCASRLLPDGRNYNTTVVFISDSSKAMTTVQNTFGPKVWIRASSLLQPILHLDKATRNQADVPFQPKDFFDTFLDMFLMAGASCVSYGQGGFGKLGSLLCQNPSCSSRHFEGGQMISCGQ